MVEVDLPLAALLGVLLVALYGHLSRRKHNYPPGPTGKPLVGSAFDLDPGRPWIRFTEWAKDYGPVMMFWTFGRPVVVLNKMEYAQLLLGKRSAIYSDRPRQIMADEIITSKMNPTLARSSYGTVRTHRRVMNEQLRAAEVKATANPVQEAERDIMLQNIIESPLLFKEHIERYAASVMLNTTYSLQTRSVDEPIVRQIVISMQRFFGAFVAGAYLVDTLHWLRFMPSWLPGQQWKRDGLRWQAEDRDMYLSLWNSVQARKEEGVGPCLVARMIDKELYGLDKTSAAYVAGALLAAGTDTTSASFTILLIAALYFPEAYKEAQRMIDAVVGRDRLPSFEDRAHLPYVEAMVQEGFRWRTAAPVGIPHALEKDDVVEVDGKQYFIPAGTTVVACLSNIHSDEKLFPEPQTFKPERFLTTDGELDPQATNAGFGFGRRVCPGQHLAEASLFILLASFAWAFDIEPYVNEKGQKELPDLDPAHWSSSAASVPPPFKCKITIRDPRVKTLVAEAEAAGHGPRTTLQKTTFGNA